MKLMIKLKENKLSKKILFFKNHGYCNLYGPTYLPTWNKISNVNLVIYEYNRVA